MPRLARKRPVTIEYVEWDGNNVGEVMDFARRTDGFTAVQWASYSPNGDARLCLRTPAGTVTVLAPHYVIKGVLPDDFYPCDPITFAATYEDIL